MAGLNASFAIQQFPLLALQSYTTLSAGHSNSPSPVYGRLSRRLFPTKQLKSLVACRNPLRSRRNFPTTTRCRLTPSLIVTQGNQGRLGGIQRKNGSRLGRHKQVESIVILPFDDPPNFEAAHAMSTIRYLPRPNVAPFPTCSHSPRASKGKNGARSPV